MSEFENADADFADAFENLLRGAGIVLLGTIVGRGAGLIGEVWIVRLFSQSQYGVFRLGILVTSLLAAVATLGFTTSLPRQVGVGRGEQDSSRVRQTIGAGLLIGLVLGLASGGAMYGLAEPIASIFDAPGLVSALQILAIALPLVVLVDLFVAVTRGLGDSKPKLVIKTLVPKLTLLLGIAVIGVANLPFQTIFLVWVLGHALAILASVLYTRVGIDLEIGLPSRTVSRSLVRFSLPLLAVYLVNTLGAWVDTFVVGYHESTAVVGLYGATVLLTRLIPMVLGSVSFMYIPVASRFHARDEQATVRLLYETVTKWIVGLTLPIFLTFMLFPGDVLTAVFGSSFREGALVMQLLAIGFLSHTLVGTNGQSLVMLGRRRFLALSQALSVGLNFIISFSLVPIIGIEGAALGSLVAFTVTNVAISVYLYHVSGLHPFSWDYLAPVATTLTIGGGFGLLLSTQMTMGLAHLVAYAVSIGILHLLIYVGTSSLNRYERTLVRKFVVRPWSRLR